MATAETHAPPLPQLIVGLGNPEPKYDGTRHNIGFEVVDALALAWGWHWQKNTRFQGWIAEGRAPRGGEKLYLLKPFTYMNRSGQAVRAVVDWYKLQPEGVLVVYDDLDLPLGRLRIRLSGSAGGHNGMKSIISHLGTQAFPRLRLGIGKSDPGETVGHVLGRFAPQERPLVNGALDLSREAIVAMYRDGLPKTMSLYNAKSVAIAP
jgi:PTH1 family peptidyl-tRNA hydrolase